MGNDLCGSRMVHRDKVDLARTQDLERVEVEKISQLFKVFSDPGRLRIIHALHKQEMCVCDLAALLEISESAVSHQLRLLRASDIVMNRREGTILYYRLVNKRLQELIDLGLSLL
jgi:DNA-binding transcriptional ArsR family regulator